MSSQSDILALRGRGFSDAQIGRSVGRNSSLISQIARGIKPGTNLAPALQSLVSGNATPGPRGAAGVAIEVKPVSRVTRSGAAAGVRKSGKTELPGGNVIVETKARGKNLLKNLEAAARQGKGVSFSTGVRRLKRYKDSANERNREVSVFGKGGYDAQAVLDAVRNQPGFDAANPQSAFDAALTDFITKNNNVEGAQGITSVTMQTFSRR